MKKYTFVHAQKTNGATIPLDLLIDSTDGMAWISANDKSLLHLIPCADGGISIYCPNEDGVYVLVAGVEKRLDGNGWKLNGHI